MANINDPIPSMLPDDIPNPVDAQMGGPLPDTTSVQNLNPLGPVSDDLKLNMAEQADELKGADSGFLESNNLVTKFVFILGALLLFLYLLRFLVTLMGWLFSDSPSPYITKGITDANTRYIISVNPNVKI